MLCPHCNTFIPVEEIDPGEWVSCGNCHATVQVPDHEHADASLAAGDTFFEDRKTAQRHMFRTFRFQSLAVAGLVAFVIALILGYAAFQAKGRRDTFASIRDLGGVVLYDYQFNNELDRFDYSASPQKWVWLHNLLGDDFVSDATAVDLGRSHTFLQSEQFGDQDLSAVEVPDFAPAIDNKQLGALDSLAALQLLSLEGQPITDRGVKRLKHFDHLVFLDLSNTKITDHCLGDLVALSHLKYLDLRGTKVTSRGLSKLARAMPKTEVLGHRPLILH